MASTPSIELRPRSVGELLDVTFHLYRRHFMPLMGITLVIMGPLLAISLLSNATSLAQYAALLNPMTGFEDSVDASGATLLSSGVSLCASGLLLLLGIATPWMDGALTFSVIERILGRAPTWRESYNATRPRWGALWVAGFLRTVVLALALIPLVLGFYGALIAGVIGLGALSASGSNTDGGLLSVGLVAICLPIGLVGLGLAVFITAAWSMITPVIVGEGADGTAALSRSNALVKGARWRMIGRLLLFEVMRLLVITLPTWILQIFIFGGAAISAEAGEMSPLFLIAFIGATIFGLVANVLTVPLYAIYITANYLDLRIRKEHLDLQLKAAQFAPAVADLPAAQSVIPTEPTAVATSADAPAPVTSATPGALVIDPSMTPAQRISVLFNQMRAQGENADLLNELGLAYQELGDHYGAMDAFSRARTLAPDDPDIAYNMALLHRDRRDVAAARRLMAEYLRLETDQVERQRALNNPALRDLMP
jgi:hypothetical protein